jgi:Flp pilus assembly protein TadD
MARLVAVTVMILFLIAVPRVYAETAQSWMDQGLQHLEQARHALAIQAFRHALELDPALVLAQYDLGVCYFALGQFDDALGAFREAQRLNPADRFTAYYLARLDLIEGRVEEAIHGFEALTRNGHVADEYYYLGSAYFRQGDFQAAVQNLHQAAAANPDDYRVPFLLARAYKKLGRETGANREFARSVKLRAANQQTARDLLACNTALDALPPASAIAECRKSLYGTDPVKLVNLGVALGRRRFYEAAIDPFVKAVRLNPEDYEPHFNLGLTYFRLKQYAHARQPLETAASLRPEAFDAVALLGSALFALGDDYSALPHLRHAHTLRPDDAKVSSLLFQELTIIAQHLREEGKYREAISSLEEALRLKPDSARLHSEVAELAAATGDASKAAREKALVEHYEKNP